MPEPAIPAPCFLKNPISHLRVRAIAFGKALSNPETYRFPLERLERARNRSRNPMLFGKSIRQLWGLVELPDPVT
jgi:hypothetical protein